LSMKINQYLKNVKYTLNFRVNMNKIKNVSVNIRVLLMRQIDI